MNEIEKKISNFTNNVSEKVRAQILQDRFISEIEELLDEKKITRKELAEKIGCSSSYITQLFRGKKFFNFLTLAKIQRAFDIEFKIEAVLPKELESNDNYFGNMNFLDIKDIFKMGLVDYNQFEGINPTYNFEIKKNNCSTKKEKAA